MTLTERLKFQKQCIDLQAKLGSQLSSLSGYSAAVEASGRQRERERERERERARERERESERERARERESERERD